MKEPVLLKEICEGVCFGKKNFMKESVLLNGFCERALKRPQFLLALTSDLDKKKKTIARYNKRTRQFCKYYNYKNNFQAYIILTQKRKKGYTFLLLNIL